MTPQVRAFRARLVAEVDEAEARGWFVDFTPEFIQDFVQRPVVDLARPWVGTAASFHCPRTGIT